MRRCLGLTALLCFFSLPASAAVDDTQIWFQYLGQGRLHKKLRYWAEAQPRYSLSQGAHTTTMLRPGLGWQVTDQLTAWVGYAWTPTYQPRFTDEHRLWVQGIYTLTLGDRTFVQRLRLESRSISGLAPTYRLRYQVRGVHPLPFLNGLSAVIYDEIFFHLKDTGPAIATGFNQNRLFGGFFYRWNPAVALDLGYMWNAHKGIGAAPNRNNHVIMTTLYVNFDFGEV